MATVATLSLVMRAETQKLRQDFKRVESATKRMGARMNSVLSGARGALAGLGIALGARALINSFQQVTEEIDKLAKTAEKLGTTVAELQELHLAANLSGISAEKMNLAMQRMTRRAAEAANGMGEAQGALKELGINAQSFVRLPMTERMKVLAAAFDKVTNPADKLRLAFKLFDSEGVDVIRVLNDQGAALKQSAAAMEKYGLAISEIDAARIEEANNELAIANAVWKKFKQDVVIGLLPLIQELTAVMAQLGVAASASGPNADTVNRFQFLSTSLAEVVDAFRAIGAVLKGIAAEFQQVSAIVANTAAALSTGGFKTFFESFRDSMTDLRDANREALRNLGKNPTPTADAVAKRIAQPPPTVKPPPEIELPRATREEFAEAENALAAFNDRVNNVGAKTTGNAILDNLKPLLGILPNLSQIAPIVGKGIVDSFEGVANEVFAPAIKEAFEVPEVAGLSGGDAINEILRLNRTNTGQQKIEEKQLAEDKKHTKQLADIVDAVQNAIVLATSAAF